MKFRDSWCCWNMNGDLWISFKKEEDGWCAQLMFLPRINFIMRKWIQFRSCHPFFDFLPLQWLRIWMRQGWRRCFRSLAMWFQWNSPGRRGKLMEGVGLPNHKIWRKDPSKATAELESACMNMWTFIETSHIGNQARIYKQYGFVHYTVPEEAEAAINGMNNRIIAAWQNDVMPTCKMPLSPVTQWRLQLLHLGFTKDRDYQLTVKYANSSEKAQIPWQRDALQNELSTARSN